jgi:monofunctional biosynthetic peptidoglycan transglycosylase
MLPGLARAGAPLAREEGTVRVADVRLGRTSPARLRAARRAAPPRRWLRLGAAVVLAFLGLSVVPTLFLRWLPPPTTSFMLQQPRAPRYRWVPWEHISSHVKIAVVASEDQHFKHHWGFDFESIGDVLDGETRRTRATLRGASTISQQLAKNLYLWPGRSWVRKALEAYFTVLIEATWPKRRILEVYLNVAQFGDGLFGVQAAAEAYWNTSADRLGPEEGARLAAVLPAPSRMSPVAPGPYVTERVAWIHQQVQKLGGSAYLRGI